MVHWCVTKSVVMRLHILVGPCWCILHCSEVDSAISTHQQGPTNICSLITHWRTILTILTKCNFSKHG